MEYMFIKNGEVIGLGSDGTQIDGAIKQEINTESPEYISYIQKRDNAKEVIKLKDWFDSEYTQQEQKLRRLITLGLPCDDGSNPNDKLLQLYNEAETIRMKIQRMGG